MNEADLEMAQGDREQLEERRSVYLLYAGSYSDRILISAHWTLAGAQAKAAFIRASGHDGGHVWMKGSYPLARDWSCVATVDCVVEIEAVEVDA